MAAVTAMYPRRIHRVAGAHQTIRRHGRSYCQHSIDDLQARQFQKIASLPRDRPTELTCDLRPVFGRHMWDGVASAEECQQAVQAAQHAMTVACDSDGADGKLFPPDVPEAKDLLGDEGFTLFTDLRNRVHRKVRSHYGPVEPVNHLLSWISGKDENCFDVHQSFDVHQWLEAHEDWLEGTYAPHVDQANQPHYSVSALLYLTTAGEDFEGGLFAFNDSDCDRLVAPLAGRLLAFDSGFDNLHHVRPVLSGERFVLSIWYSDTRRVDT